MVKWNKPFRNDEHGHRDTRSDISISRSARSGRISGGGLRALVYAIANKRPGVALAAVLLPLVALAGFGLLAGLLIPAITYRAGPSPQAHMSYHEDAPRIADTGFDV